MCFPIVFLVCSTYLGKFPPRYIGNIQNGICIGGIIPVLVNIIILSMDVDMQVRIEFAIPEGRCQFCLLSKIAGMASFVFSCSICVLCLVLFFFMEKTEYYQYHHNLEPASAAPSELDFDKEMGDYDDTASLDSTDKSGKMTKDLLFKILRKTWMFNLALLLNGVATSSIYPVGDSTKLLNVFRFKIW